MDIADSELSDIERLRWQCRRGMLELDMLLEAFLDQGYSELPPQQQRRFIALLSYPDPLIHAWCVAGEAPDDEGFGELIAAIRSTNLA